MQTIRLPLLLKLAIIFLAVMVVPAAIVAVYVKQQFDEITLSNRLENLGYGRASLSALLEDEWNRMLTLGKSLDTAGNLLLDSDGELVDRILAEGRGLVLYNRQGETLLDRTIECCLPQELYRTVFSDDSRFEDFMTAEPGEDFFLSFQQGDIILLHLRRLEYPGQDPGLMIIQSSIGSYVFDMFRRVSGLETSIVFAGLDQEHPVLSGRVSLPVIFSTGMNEYAERRTGISIPLEVWESVQRFQDNPTPPLLFTSNEFALTVEDGQENVLLGVLPLINSRFGSFFALMSIPQSEAGSPEEIEYLWVIISALFILVLLMSLLITMYVVAPIMNLNQGVEGLRKSIGTERGFEELRVHSNDEIGDLANSFNLLARELTLSLDKIRLQRREILEYAQNLEDKVKERTQEAEAARVRAEMANVHKSKFLVNMNHEFRTPLNSISGITDLLSYGAYDKNDEIALVLEKIERLREGKSPPLVSRLKEFLFDESNPMYFLLELIREELLAAEDAEGAPDSELQSLFERLEQLVQEEEKGKFKAYGNISEAGKTLIHIVDDVINLSRIESGAIDIHPEPSSLSEIVNYAVVHSESYCRAKGKTALLQIKHQIKPELPDRIVVDHYRIKQILMNLMSNAIKYTEAGEILLMVDRKADQHGEYIRFSVKDQGIGIDPRDHHLIFREFGRTFKVRDIEGTGLGLAISRKLVEAHGGDVGFSSRPGEGSLFWFTIPLELVHSP